jgi:N-6 DNA Methylase
VAGDHLNEVGVAVSLDSLRERARRFSKRFADATREEADSQTFWNEFLGMFDIDRRQVSTFEFKAQRASTGGKGRVDLLWPGEMAVEQKSRGKDLNEAMDQVVDYLASLAKAEHPWLAVASDFEQFEWRDFRDGQSGRFLLQDLAENVELFAWMAGHRRPGEHFADEEEVNLKATAYLAAIHDRLEVNGYNGHSLRVWLTRILFCLFADDSGIFEKAAFHSHISTYTATDGNNLGQVLAEIFQWLDKSEDERPAALNEQLRNLPYVNGDLFDEVLPIPVCDEAVRNALLEACKFDWSHIAPAIFGSMFQNVMEPAERRQLGAHYTSERDILRAIGPLFLDDLEATLAAANSKPKLRALLDRLPTLKFMDPACGCGNFLVIAYRELRRIEAEAVRKLRHKEGRGAAQTLDVTLELKVRVDQFYGIEIEEFPARIARTALYLMDHLANRRASKEFGIQILRFPIPAAPNIAVGNALTLDWSDVLPVQEASYVFGNPPFGGHKYRTKAQSQQLQAVWGSGYAKWLDYVTGWYRKALDYGRDQAVQFAFVSTNSICQGEQVARLWRPLIDAGYGVQFAHQTFAWTSEAKGAAHVHVVIVGFAHGRKGNRLFVYDDLKAEPKELAASNISPYLTDGPDVAVAGRSTPLSSEMPPVDYGSLPSDGGGLVVSPSDLPVRDPVAMKYIRPYLGSKELVNKLERWCIWAPDGLDPGDRKRSAFLNNRLDSVKQARLASVNPDTKALADQPTRFFHVAQPTRDYVGIPAQVSETRRWYTVAQLTPEDIASNTLYTADDPSGFLLGLLSSTMFAAWIRGVGGNIKSDLRYAKSVVHNTFPLPDDVPEVHSNAVAGAGRNLLAVRTQYPAASLADLYDPLSVRRDLLQAHADIDSAVDRIFSPRKRKWAAEERLALLLDRYASMERDRS